LPVFPGRTNKKVIIAAEAAKVRPSSRPGQGAKPHADDKEKWVRPAPPPPPPLLVCLFVLLLFVNIMRSVSLWVQQNCLIHDDLPRPFFTHCFRPCCVGRLEQTQFQFMSRVRRRSLFSTNKCARYLFWPAPLARSPSCSPTGIMACIHSVLVFLLSVICCRST
jgi:hypothetical protein